MSLPLGGDFSYLIRAGERRTHGGVLLSFWVLFGRRMSSTLTSSASECGALKQQHAKSIFSVTSEKDFHS